jgi:hypothetical protein
MRRNVIRTLVVGLSVLCLLMSVSIVRAQDVDTEAEDPAETTIRLMGVAEAELPEAITKEITLPPAAIENSAAIKNAERGLATADENPDRRENGLSRADEARERGEAMADEAAQNRENRGRSDDRPSPPEPPNGPPNN